MNNFILSLNNIVFEWLLWLTHRRIILPLYAFHALRSSTISFMKISFFFFYIYLKIIRRTWLEHDFMEYNKQIISINMEFNTCLRINYEFQCWHFHDIWWCRKSHQWDARSLRSRVTYTREENKNTLQKAPVWSRPNTLRMLSQKYSHNSRVLERGQLCVPWREGVLGLL